MFFDRDAWERFRLTKDEFALVKEADEKLAKRAAGFERSEGRHRDPSRAEKKDLVLDLDGTRRTQGAPHDRIVVTGRRAREQGRRDALLPRALRAGHEPLVDEPPHEGDEDGPHAQRQRRQHGVGQGRRRYIFLLADGAISRIDPTTAKRDMVAMSGEEALDVDAERAAMFDHVWRRTRDTFYSKGYHGIDWVGLRPIYAKYLPVHRQQLRVRRDAGRDARRAEHQPQRRDV